MIIGSEKNKEIREPSYGKREETTAIAEDYYHSGRAKVTIFYTNVAFLSISQSRMPRNAYFDKFKETGNLVL